MKRRRNPKPSAHARPGTKTPPALANALAKACYVQKDAGEAMRAAMDSGNMPGVRKYAAQIERAAQDERDIRAALDEVGARAGGHWIASRDRHARDWYQSDFTHAKIVGDRARAVISRRNPSPTLAMLTDARKRAAGAIRSAVGANVELTPARGNTWCVSGQRADVVKAREVMRQTGLRLQRTEFDPEWPGEQFDFYAEARKANPARRPATRRNPRDSRGRYNATIKGQGRAAKIHQYVEGGDFDVVYLLVHRDGEEQVVGSSKTSYKTLAGAERNAKAWLAR